MIHGSATVENSSVVAAPLTPPQKLCETGVPVIMELRNGSPGHNGTVELWSRMDRPHRSSSRRSSCTPQLF